MSNTPAKPLNPKQRRFVAEYLRDQNGTQAAIRAGYSKKTARVQAAQLLALLNIKAEVDAKLTKVEEKCGITVEYVLEGLRDVAERCRRDGKEFDSTGANRALELLGKYRQMFTDKVQHSGSINVEDLLGGSRV